jgi:hypothetical protein
LNYLNAKRSFPVNANQLPNHLEAHVSERDALIGLALGRASELRGVSHGELQRELGRRQIAVHYDLDDLANDLAAVRELAAR